MIYYKHHSPVNLDNTTSFCKVPTATRSKLYKIRFWFMDEEDFITWNFDTEEERDKVYDSILDNYCDHLVVPA